MYGLICYLEPVCVMVDGKAYRRYVNRTRRIEDVSVLVFQEKVRYFKMKNDKCVVRGTIHSRSPIPRPLCKINTDDEVKS